MPSEQRIIPLNLKSGDPRQAVGYGNKAAWTCPCGRGMPLSGRTGDPAIPGDQRLVVCPDCRRRFRVGGPDPQGRSLVVDEVAEEAAGSRR